MRFQFALTLQAIWTGMCHAAMQHYPAAWGHYDVCKSQVYSDEGLTWDYMACQPEAADMTQFLKVSLDPPNITCGDPPETYCALVSTLRELKSPLSRKERERGAGGRQLSHQFISNVCLLGMFWPHGHDKHSQKPVWLRYVAVAEGIEAGAHWRHVLLFGELRLSMHNKHNLMSWRCHWKHWKMWLFQLKKQAHASVALFTHHSPFSRCSLSLY